MIPFRHNSPPPTAISHEVAKPDQKRAFAAKKLELPPTWAARAEMINFQSKPEDPQLPEIERVWIAPRVPVFPLRPPSVAPVTLPPNSGLSQLEAVSRDLSRNMKEIQSMTNEIAANEVKLEAHALACKQTAELTRVLSAESAQQLNQMQLLRSSRGFFADLIDGFKALIALDDPE
jgi:hypothetical protein